MAAWAVLDQATRSKQSGAGQYANRRVSGGEQDGDENNRKDTGASKYFIKF